MQKGLNMKKYSNIPLKERKRNADRCYRHEVRAEERANRRAEIDKKRELQEYIEMKEKLYEQEREHKTDKEQQEDEAFARLKEIAKRSEE